jgi:hypothetical protein
MIEGACRICHWLYNHNKLHAMMRQAIGGELMRWNATRFDTNYMFLESMFHRKDNFMAWMSSPGFLESRFSSTEEGRCAHSCLSSLTWWDTMQYVLKGVEPLFAFLRFVDQDKIPNMSEVLLRFHICTSEYESLLRDYPTVAHFFLFHIAAQWWAMFGGDTPTLQNLALRLVSQCCSSSRCERNWSTFALIHTKVHNRLSYKKLHKLVYVNYNLCICLRQASLYKREEGSFDKLMELSLYNAQNLIRVWMEHGRSNANPLLDEEDTHSDTPIPSRLVMKGDNDTTLRIITVKASLVDWADETLVDTHIGR